MDLWYRLLFNVYISTKTLNQDSYTLLQSEEVNILWGTWKLDYTWFESCIVACLLFGFIESVQKSGKIRKFFPDFWKISMNSNLKAWLHMVWILKAALLHICLFGFIESVQKSGKFLNFSGKYHTCTLCL